MDCWSWSIDAADAKKAEGASIWTLRMPKPPSRTGSEACIHWSSIKSTFKIVVRPARNVLLLLLTALMRVCCLVSNSQSLRRVSRPTVWRTAQSLHWMSRVKCMFSFSANSEHSRTIWIWWCCSWVWWKLRTWNCIEIMYRWSADCITLHYIRKLFIVA